MNDFKDDAVCQLVQLADQPVDVQLGVLHQLKGAGASFGMKLLADNLADIEEKIKSAKMELDADETSHLANTVLISVRAIEEYLLG
ncbi:Hpt domain-containing protein [Persicirhabdus sediminis]|uniref:Hpt domain-containing protein n=1 Tax=Persicirhabdus sediminis TaxID=454144 RepID=A0A8J7MDJ8_9BACT|nr:Hpt domain-containing protein [Persicirhabdus sediminis]MBK1790543.1 Hpt domain-containing protein [Persicirhabdus sediminis]